MSEYEFDENGFPTFVPAAKRRKEIEVEPEVKTVKEVVTTNVDSNGSTTSRKLKTKEVKGGPRKLQLLESKLPGGGTIHLLNPQEASYFEAMKKRYVDEYQLSKPNDLTRLGQLLMMELASYRLSQKMMGQIVLYDDQGNFDKYESVDEVEKAQARTDLPKLQDEIRKLENHLRLDKKSREGGGQHDIREYMANLKEYARQHGVHLSERYTNYDGFANELRMKMRILDNADATDKAYSGVSEEKILQWIRQELSKMEELDKTYAHDVQSLWVGNI